MEVAVAVVDDVAALVGAVGLLFLVRLASSHLVTGFGFIPSWCSLARTSLSSTSPIFQRATNLSLSLYFAYELGTCVSVCYYASE